MSKMWWMMNSRLCFLIAGLSGALTVGLGAFGAHGLKEVLSPYLLDVYQTAVQYQMWHTLALFGCGILLRNSMSKGVSYAALLFTIGIIFFSGSLYALVFTGIKWFGPITPLGGLCFISGWLTLAVSTYRLTEVSK